MPIDVARARRGPAWVAYAASFLLAREREIPLAGGSREAGVHAPAA